MNVCDFAKWKKDVSGSLGAGAGANKPPDEQLAHKVEFIRKFNRVPSNSRTDTPNASTVPVNIAPPDEEFVDMQGEGRLCRINVVDTPESVSVEARDGCREPGFITAQPVGVRFRPVGLAAELVPVEHELEVHAEKTGIDYEQRLAVSADVVRLLQDHAE